MTQAYEGKSAKFACSFTGDQPLTVTWMKNGQELKTGIDAQVRCCLMSLAYELSHALRSLPFVKTSSKSPHCTQVDTTVNQSVLRLPKVERKHEGNYTCKIVNVAGSVESTANLQVMRKKEEGQAPTFTRSVIKCLQMFFSTSRKSDAFAKIKRFRVFADQSVVQSQIAQFDVAVSGQPMPIVSWFKASSLHVDIRRLFLKDGHALSGSTRYKVLKDDEKHALVVHDAVASDAGVFFSHCARIISRED